MTRRLPGLVVPLAIWVAVFGWRTVACKGKPEAAKDSGKAKIPTIVYRYPPVEATPTFRPGLTPVILPE